MRLGSLAARILRGARHNYVTEKPQHGGVTPPTALIIPMPGDAECFTSNYPEQLSEEAIFQEIQRILYATKDSEFPIGKDPAPAISTLLYRVCYNDTSTFEEACRVIELFIREAIVSRPTIHVKVRGGGGGSSGATPQPEGTRTIPA